MRDKRLLRAEEQANKLVGENDHAACFVYHASRANGCVAASGYQAIRRVQVDGGRGL